MRIETILNNCQKFKSFVYSGVKWIEHDGEKCLTAIITPRKNGNAICSCCHKVVSCYESLEERLFEFVPLWGYRFFFIYQMRRVDCKKCGIKAEEVPWATGKSGLTKTFLVRSSSQLQDNLAEGFYRNKICCRLGTRTP